MLVHGPSFFKLFPSLADVLRRIIAALPKTPSLSEGLARAYLQVAFSSTIASEDALSDFASAVTHLAAVDVQVVAEDASKRAAAVDTFLGIWLASATSLLSRRLSLEPVHSSLLGFTKNLLAAERTRVLQTLAGELSATDETTTPRIAEAAASAVHVILKDGAEGELPYLGCTRDRLR